MHISIYIYIYCVLIIKRILQKHSVAQCQKYSACRSRLSGCVGVGGITHRIRYGCPTTTTPESVFCCCARCCGPPAAQVRHCYRVQTPHCCVTGNQIAPPCFQARKLENFKPNILIHRSIRLVIVSASKLTLIYYHCPKE